MSSRYTEESGFTLVELLVVIGTIWVLVAISMANYGVYKERLYLSHADDVSRQLRMAVESAKIELGMAEDITDLSKCPWVLIVKNAAPQGLNWAPLLSGYSHDDHMRIYVDHDGICEAGFFGNGCQVTTIQVRHCNTDVTKVWFLLNDGTEGSLEFNNGAGC